MRKLFRFNGGIVMFYCILTAVMLLTVETGYGLRMGQMPMESQTKIVEPIDRAISLKLPILQPEFHWEFVNKEDFLAGKLVLYITRGDETTTITIFENGKISEGWEPMVLPQFLKTGEIYFGFQSTRKYPTAPGDRLKVEFIAKKDLDGIGAIETGILPAGRYVSEGTYSGLIDEFPISPALRKDASEETISKIRQMYEFKAFLENWETQWSLQITSGEGWLPPAESRRQSPRR